MRCPSEHELQSDVGLRLGIEDMIMRKRAGATLVLSGGQVIATRVFQRIGVGGDHELLVGLTLWLAPFPGSLTTWRAGWGLFGPFSGWSVTGVLPRQLIRKPRASSVLLAP